MISILLFIYFTANVLVSICWIDDWRNGKLTNFTDVEKPIALVLLILFAVLLLIGVLIWDGIKCLR